LLHVRDGLQQLCILCGCGFQLIGELSGAGFDFVGTHLGNGQIVLTVTQLIAQSLDGRF
jgi:hypothetical protein